MRYPELLEAAHSRFLFGFGKVKWSDPLADDFRMVVEWQGFPSSGQHVTGFSDPIKLVYETIPASADPTIVIIGGQYGMGDYPNPPYRKHLNDNVRAIVKR